MDRAFRAAADAFENGWRDSTPAERQIILNKIADAVEERADELVAAEVENCGKPVKATREEEIWQVTDALRFFAGAARVLEGKAAGEYMADHTSWIRREPIGVVGQITPWNYPMAMAAWKIGPALAAGNTIVLKPSDTTPVSTLLLAEIAAEFLPPGVFNVVTGDRDTGRALVDHPIPRLVSLTGSTRAGYEVAQSASRDLKRLPPGAGRQGPGDRLRRRGRREGRRRHRRSRVLQRGTGLHAATRVLAAPGIHDDLAAALLNRQEDQDRRPGRGPTLTTVR